MQKLLLSLSLSLAVALGLSACQIVYRLPTRQGNVVDQKDVDKLKVGMTRDQVKFVMGTPIATSPFREDRWDYFGYYKSPRGHISQRIVSLYFEGDQLARLDGAQGGDDLQLSTPDVETVIKQEKKDKAEKERGSSPAPAPAPST
jgi:outer membrane protein assembly factor BamE